MHFCEETGFKLTPLKVVRDEVTSGDEKKETKTVLLLSFFLFLPSLSVPLLNAYGHLSDVFVTEKLEPGGVAKPCPA